MPQHVYSVALRDYSNEESHTKFNFGAVTAVSIAGLLAQLGDLRNAIAAVTLGVLARDSWTGDRTVLSNAAATDPHAQIELKFQVSYEGNTSHKQYRSEIPTADPTKTIAGSDQCDLAQTEIAALVTAIEAVARTPDDDQETVNVTGVRLVGRNV